MVYVTVKKIKLAGLAQAEYCFSNKKWKATTGYIILTCKCKSLGFSLKFTTVRVMF